jgi:hypothetical protein
MKSWPELEKAYFSGELYTAPKSELQEYLIIASNPPPSENPTFRDRAAQITAAVRLLIQLAETREQNRATLRWARLAAVAAILSTALLIYQYGREFYSHSVRAPAPRTTAAQHVTWKSSVIENNGVASITIRNNNVFPIRNVQLRVQFIPPVQ